MNNKKETVCTVIVTYNRKVLLLECLEALRKQTRSVDAIYLIDNNSTDSTPELLMEKGYISELPPTNLAEPWEREFQIKNLVNDKVIKFHYVRMHENTGGAGGFYEGMKRAYEKGYDWLWLMDDDVLPKQDCLEQLLAIKDLGALPSVRLPLRENLKRDKIHWYPFFSKVILRSWNSSPLKSNSIYFEGVLIRRDIVEKIGFPERKFFTVLDDTEYGLRISAVARILYVENAILVRLLNNTSVQSLNRRYYFFRNLFLLAELHRIPLIWTIVVVFFQILFSVCKTLAFQRDKIKTIKILIMAYIDGLKRNFGKANYWR